MGSENSLVTSIGGAGVHAGCSVFDIIGASLVYAGAEFDFDDGGDGDVGVYMQKVQTW